MNIRIFIVAFIALLLLILIFLVSCKYITRNNGVVARVNGQAITDKELDNRANQLVIFYKQSNQAYDEKKLREQALNNLIDLKLMQQYAVNNDIKIDENKVNELYLQRQSGYKNKTDLLQKLKIMYGIDEQQYLAILREDVLRETMTQSIDLSITKWLSAERSRSKIDIYL